jgi:hypothetical protein
MRKTYLFLALLVLNMVQGNTDDYIPFSNR